MPHTPGGLPHLQRGCLRLAAASLLIPSAAAAHVKWFCSIADVNLPPIGLGRVLTPLFAAVCVVFVLLVFGGFLLDATAARRWPRFASSGARHGDLEERLVRLATGAFFLLLWDKGAVVLWERGDAILTPELMLALSWMGPLHFAIAVSVAWRKSCAAAAAGILVIFGYGIAYFGIFHMTDYVFFPGLAAYLALTALGTERARRLRVPIVVGSLAFSLMWTAIEKFVYPNWTLFVVAEHPDLTFGFPGGFVVVVAGFVEFTLAFYVMTGSGLVRIGAAAYTAIFIAAIPEFGHLDAVGHLPIIAILAIAVLRGGAPLQRRLGIAAEAPLAHALAVAVLYVATMVGFFGLYYGLRAAEYG